METSVNESSTLTAALNILRNSPAADRTENLSHLQELMSPNSADALNELTQYVQHLPLQTSMAEDDNDNNRRRPYICCSWNRRPDGSYSPPWKNGSTTSSSADDETNKHKLQVAHANELWNTYAQMYYGSSAVASVYSSSTSSSSALRKNNNNTKEDLLCFLIQHTLPRNNGGSGGEWNSVHIVQPQVTTTTGPTPSTAAFSIDSHVLVSIGKDITAHISKHTTTTSTTKASPSSSSYNIMEMIGPTLERIETEMRRSLENVQLPKLGNFVSTSIRTSTTTRNNKSSNSNVVVANNDDKKVKSTVGGGGMTQHMSILNQAVLARAAAMKTKK